MDYKFFERNRKHLGELLEEGSIVILFSGKAPKKSADEEYPFTPNRNFYYLTGTSEQDIILVMTQKEGKQEDYLFIKRADPVMAKWVGETISMEKAKEVSGISNIYYLDQFKGFIHDAFSKPETQRVYLDLERSSFDEAMTKEQLFAQECQQKYPFLNIKNVYPIIARLRMVKAPEEIKQLIKAIDITKEGIEALMQHAMSDMYEYQLEAYFDFALKTRGVKDFAFKTIAASGKNATVLHYSSNDSIIEKDSLILFDLGAQYEYYNADISRTIPVSGKFTERQKLFYNIVLQAHDAVIKHIKPGVTIKLLNDLTRKIYFKALQKIGMVQTEAEVTKYYFHSVSHHLGLDTHDTGERTLPLEEGMVITVEPGLYIEEEGIGIRIEDDVVVTKEGCKVLSKGIIRTVEEIEAYMAQHNKQGISFFVGKI